jgi:hypothetical protein
MTLKFWNMKRIWPSSSLLGPKYFYLKPLIKGGVYVNYYMDNSNLTT